MIRNHANKLASVQTPVPHLLGIVFTQRLSRCSLQPTLVSHSSLLLSPSQILDVRNVMVVVSRWYGGILLGPDRFKHINNCARNILVEEGHAASTVRGIVLAGLC